jgi:nitrate reductase gamma subunit
MGTVELWYDFARGPLLRLALVVLVLGLARQVALLIWGMAEALWRARDRRIPYRLILMRMLSWLFPITHLHRARAWLSLLSFVFHIGLLVSALFLREHIDLWQTNVGVAWLAAPRPLADVLTIVAILTGAGLLLYRVYVRRARAISDAMDYLLLVLLLILCVTGFVAARPWNPVPYPVTMLIHALVGISVVVLIPFTKLTHCVLYPLVRFASEIGWHFAPGTGERVVRTLHGSEGRKI